ncbi:uncharacterized protein HaLaN_08495, partial [Haematococcus lacustris]
MPGRRLVLKLRPAFTASSNELAAGVPSFVVQPPDQTEAAGNQLYFMTVENQDVAGRAACNSRSVGSSVVSAATGEAGPLVDGLELGALLGRGAFGSVYAGTC